VNAQKSVPQTFEDNDEEEEGYEEDFIGENQLQEDEEQKIEEN
jgi:hypothetical protein